MSPADRLIRVHFRPTEGQPDQWRMIAAIDTAMRASWIEIEGGHSVRLTEVGRRKVDGEHIDYSAQLISGTRPCPLAAKGRGS